MIILCNYAITNKENVVQREGVAGDSKGCRWTIISDFKHLISRMRDGKLECKT